MLFFDNFEGMVYWALNSLSGPPCDIPEALGRKCRTYMDRFEHESKILNTKCFIVSTLGVFIIPATESVDDSQIARCISSQLFQRLCLAVPSHVAT